jgi:hypothetical protein
MQSELGWEVGNHACGSWMSQGTRDSESRNQRMRASYLPDVTSARIHRSRLHAYHVIGGLLGGRVLCTVSSAQRAYDFASEVDIFFRTASQVHDDFLRHNK